MNSAQNAGLTDFAPHPIMRRMSELAKKLAELEALHERDLERVVRAQRTAEMRQEQINAIRLAMELMGERPAYGPGDIPKRGRRISTSTVAGAVREILRTKDLPSPFGAEAVTAILLERYQKEHGDATVDSVRKALARFARHGVIATVQPGTRRQAATYRQLIDTTNDRTDEDH
jgi:hypothetical protein